MRRREFIALVGAAAASPKTVGAQHVGGPYRIGFLSAAAPSDPNLGLFLQGMRGAGYIEGVDFVLESRFASRDYARFPALVQEILRAKVGLVVTIGAASRAAPFAAQSVPVVFGFSGDPVDAGLVASFARPGGNATGVSFLALDLAAKRPELLKEFAPSTGRIGVLSNPEHPGEVSELRVTRETTGKLGVDTRYVPLKSDTELPTAFDVIAKAECDALLVFPDALTLFHRDRIAAFALSRRLPSVFGWRAFADAGGLISYGPNLRHAVARLAYFVDRILKGSKPADLPVETPTALELVLNLTTANALGLKPAQSLLARADEVIE
jgi:putative tryptophan/tyrosine transport system substrate-binding protein